MHQIGSKINVYKSAFLRSGSGSGGGSSSGCPRIPNNMSFASVRSTRRRYFRESSEGDPPAAAATENSSKARIARAAPSSSARASRFSLMFSLEDLTTDSTSVLKDSLSRRGSSTKGGPPVRRGRPPQLDRSVSCVTKGPAMLPQLKGRTRYLSEGHGSDEGRRPFSLKGSRFKLIPPVMADPKGEKEEDGEGGGGSVSEVLLAKGGPDRDSESAGARAEGASSSSVAAKVREMLGACFDPTVLRDPVFVLLTACVCTMTVGAPHLLFFLPAYAVQGSGRSCSSVTQENLAYVTLKSDSKSLVLVLCASK